MVLRTWDSLQMDDYGIYRKVHWVKIPIKFANRNFINRKLHKEKGDLEKEENANSIWYHFSWIC